MAVKLVIQLSFSHIETSFLHMTTLRVINTYINTGNYAGGGVSYLKLGSSLVILVVHISIPWMFVCVCVCVCVRACVRGVCVLGSDVMTGMYY